MAARHYRRPRANIEWPTLFVLGICYVAWALITFFHEQIGLWLTIPGAIYAVALHSSLQHEALHGHPTRWRTLNEGLIFFPVGLYIPYQRFRSTHLRHHCDERLTDPYDDPESRFVAERDWDTLSRPMRVLLEFNATLSGRLLVGPALSILGLWLRDWPALRAGDKSICRAYALHASGVFLVLAWLIGVCAIDPLVYTILIAYPAISCLMLRTFAEHRAHEEPAKRSAIIEACPIVALLFLNNNLHHVHHASPRTPWYELPKLYRAEKEKFISENGGYGFKGYGDLFRRHLFRPIGTIIHPFLYRKEQS